MGYVAYFIWNKLDTSDILLQDSIHLVKVKWWAKWVPFDWTYSVVR